ncbi:hypothetical protein [Hyphobacterium sp.]|uniref:hypothetical protein n=1 Tax=Hyphobacterium sp. TaxID=2004662 RepID=UPI0037494D06
MFRIFIISFALASSPSFAQSSEDWPPPPGPICGEVESGVVPEFRRHEAELTPERFRAAIDAMNTHVLEWTIGSTAYNFPGSEADMAWTNHMTIIRLYVLKLEALSAEGEEQQLAINRFCDALSTALVMD